MMKRLGINFVLDVGANFGGYAVGLREGGYKGAIWSYEPLHDAFADLAKASANDDLWKAVNCACGAIEGNAVMNVAKNGYSSSMRRMLELHSMNAPDANYISQESISVCTLDESVMPSLKPSDSLWLKIDTQGFEAEVLKGATRLMHHVSALECELSTFPLYEGQALLDELISSIYKMGFRMVGITPVFFEKETGYQLQIDGTFLRIQKTDEKPRR
jgi:FkbM family methyltransferase